MAMSTSRPIALDPSRPHCEEKVVGGVVDGARLSIHASLVVVVMSQSSACVGHLAFDAAIAGNFLVN